MKRLVLLLTLFVSITSLAQTIKTDSIIIRPNHSEAQAGNVISHAPTLNDTAHENILTAVWTCGGPCIWRFYMRFNLDSLPANATIQSARLSLFCDNNSLLGYNGTPTFGTSNAAVIYRVTSPWADNNLNWNTQPTTTNSDSIVLAQSTSTSQNYTSIDMKTMVTNMISGGNHGFMIKHNQENTPYNSLIFHSSKATDPTKRPMLKIVYQYTDTSTHISSVASAERFSIAPNPTNGRFTISLSKPADAGTALIITDATGRTIISKPLSTHHKTGNQYAIDLRDYPRGLYFVQLVANNQPVAVQKLLLH